jgi:uncharacterized membrane protein YcaP (DUF421 family)
VIVEFLVILGRTLHFLLYVGSVLILMTIQNIKDLTMVDGEVVISIGQPVGEVEIKTV